MRKISALAISVLSLVILSACAQTDTGDVTTGSSSSSVSSESLVSSDSTSSDVGVMLDVSSAKSVASQAEASSTPVATMRKVQVQISNFAYTPATIFAKKGEKVQLQIVGTEGTHGFASKGLNLNVRVPEGETVVVDLPTDKAGTFEVYCSVPCGSGHKSMKATIVIE